MRRLILIFLLLAALACYVAGSVYGMSIFFMLGVLLEMAFWLGLFKPGRKKTENIS